MTNILNAQEAFTALRSGKTVLCRHILGEFDSLDQFPATVFALPEHEFCIKIETIELAGITFTKPLSIEEVQPEQDVFLIQPQAVILQYKFNENIEELVTGIRSGFAQRDFENAKRQYEAICSAVGGSIFEVSLELAEQPKKKRQSKKQNESAEIKQQSNQAANDDNSLDDIIGPVTAQCPTSNDVEKKTSTDLGSDDVVLNQLLKVDSIELLEKMEASFNKRKANISDDKVQTFSRIFEQKREELTSDPELSILFDAFIAEIDSAKSENDLKVIRTRINSNGDLTEVENAELATRLNLKIASFEKEQSTVPFENIAAAVVTKAQEIDNQIQERQWTRFHNDKPCLDLGDKTQYEIEYADLTAVVIHAQSPDEANSVVVKTQHWTEEQRKPLLSAISKRLCELQEQSKVKSNEPPSLMVLIQNAPDLTALDALEIDVSARHPDIQPRLMGYVKKRRFELEQPTLVSSIDEELP
ncbi:hypothetical protein [Acinetobacter beijerinckii]|uniref:Uncharacterized protein n=1 Tax=Acinetobacter beijerinckii ANC 3835 TaxID=1217649 RepID=N9E5E6_9GAMM|nr:hypothetical protein [Acinetobacter beijerinckii]ENW05708.1 hypothetical protein F934_01065 [Acinetobacter beijerinckii ANC 3835]